MGINIGEKIKQRAKELRIGPTEFAKLISSTKQNIYSIYSRKSIDTQLLQNISKALHFDFFRYYVSPDLSFINERALGELAIRFTPDKHNHSGKDGARINPKSVKELTAKLSSMNQRLEEITRELHYLKKINQLLEAERKK